MKTDRELLEIVAKIEGRTMRYMTIEGQNPEELIAYWNPLADDGDAFRLALLLELPIKYGLNGTIETGNAKSGRPIWEFCGSDPCAAARRAIVRAAAAIGEYEFKNNA